MLRKIDLVHIINNNMLEKYYNISYKNIDLSGSYITNVKIRDANFSDAIFRNCEFTNVEFIRCDFSGANLDYSQFIGCAFISCILSKTDFYRSNIIECRILTSGGNRVSFDICSIVDTKIWNCDFTEANMHSVTLKRNTDIRGSKFIRSNFRNSVISFVNGIVDCDFNGSDFTGAIFTNVNLGNSKFSGCKGILKQSTFLENLEKTDEGYIAYKTFGAFYEPPKYWNIKKGSVIEEIVCHDRSIQCSFGINVGTRDWIKDNSITFYAWKVLIKFEDIADICVPYNTNGKFRVGKCTLIDELDIGDRYILQC
jgi:uncharacterized protein YjbI with pentapeptide repeats